MKIKKFMLTFLIAFIIGITVDAQPDSDSILFRSYRNLHHRLKNLFSSNDYGEDDSNEHYYEENPSWKGRSNHKVDPVQALCNPLLADGDIMLGTDALTYSTTPSKVQLWPNGVIPYKIHSDLWMDESIIKQSMRHIESQTCITFKPRSSEKDYVEIIKGNGCYSYVGKLKRGGAQPLSIGEGCEYIGSVVHELIHAIGFHHEHSRSDRDQFVKVQWHNLDPRIVQQFAKVDPKHYPQLYGFDYESVMLYGSTAFSRDGRSTTLMPIRSRHKRLTEVYHKHGMSPTDARRIRKLYQCGH